MPATVNEQLFDALVRHQIGLLRLSDAVRRKAQKVLDATEADMAANIRRKLANTVGLNTPASVRRLQLLLKSIRATRLKAWDQITPEWITELRETAKAEPVFLDLAVKNVSPVILDVALPSPAFIGSIAVNRPFAGKVLKAWANKLRNDDVARIEGQIRIGLVQGENSAAIARRVVGTARLRGSNGVTEITRRDAASVTRTAVNALTNMAKREFYQDNTDIIREEVYVAVLDSRTTIVCASKDGKRFPVGKGPMPPLHFNCRSLRAAVLDGIALGKRPARPFTEQQLRREYGQAGGQRYDDFKRARIRQLTGRVPARTSYGEWLKKQSVDFQDDVLGVTRARLFRKGGLPLDRFVNRKGGDFTLAQLAQRDSAAFAAAGLDPGDF